MTFWTGRRVLVTGGGGFFGRHLVGRLEKEKPAAILAPRSREHDLRDAGVVARLLAEARPDVVLHAAAAVGGIGANRLHPGSFFYDNAAMGLNLIEGSRRAGVGKLVCLGTVCAYPGNTPVPFREDDLWSGYPEETNAPYGLAKKMLLVQLQGYRKEYGFSGIYLIPVNLYGPGDNFDPESSHVIPAMIRRLAEAKDSGAPEVVFWGDGTPTREFLHAADAAEAVVLAAERYDGPAPVNVGTGAEISIRDLAAKIARLTGYTGRIAWDPSKPNGQMRRRLDTSRARAAFGFSARIGFDEGLAETVAWWRNEGRGAGR
ncbi:MAG TPA: GDP-L-fucose synthase [Thermoanaerobaculia bacterium]|nr:GDP-L-fucose synthase [Thermoanaerobaculia bacterium]